MRSPGGVGACHHAQVGAFHGGFQERLGRAYAPPAALIDVEVADAFVVAGVEVIAVGQSPLVGGFAEGIKYFPSQALFLDTPFAA